MTLSEISICINQGVKKIPVITNIFERKSSINTRIPVRKTVKRSNRILEATNLPLFLLLNPRSIYNKKNEFWTMMEQMEVDICAISESWNRDTLPLEDFLKKDGYRIIKNVLQRSGKGGKPALVIKEEKFYVKQLCPDIITVPVGIEAVWALITPKNVNPGSKVRNIAVASMYYTKATKRATFIDHICETFNILSAKYGPNLHFAVCGDMNRLNINPILSLSPALKQLITVPTRKNPDATLENIISTLEYFYISPYTITPLENDEDKSGKPSDHLPVVFKPMSCNETRRLKYRTVKYRPVTESGLKHFGDWLETQTWSEILESETAHVKAERFQSMLIAQLDISLPEKVIKINENDKPWVNQKIKKLDRKCKREYSKHKKSKKWKFLKEILEEEIIQAKENYYENIVEDLKVSDVGKWYSKLKRMSCDEKNRADDVYVESIASFPMKAQAEMIADRFAEVSNEYESLKYEDIDISKASNAKPFPWIAAGKINNKIKKMKTKTSTVIGDIPWKVIRQYSYYLSVPLENIYNRSVKYGEYPSIWKVEIVTPVPKVHPPTSEGDLRKIACTLNFSKIFENILSEYLISDMKPSSDPSQFGNEKGISVQHCLIKMLDTIHKQLDINNEKEAYAAIISMVDYSQAFDRQCPLLGVQSFIRNGVRRDLIPILISFFQNRKMKVKWNGIISTTRDLPGGGPQGSTTGLLEYKSQTNNNCDFVPTDKRYKWVDDLSILEMINLLSVGLASYNFKQHVASDIGINQKYLSNENIQTQQYSQSISEWTNKNKMKLNVKKTKVMVINFTKDYQFSTRIFMEGQLLEIIEETKLLGCIISSDLKFQKNTSYMVKKAYARMTILQKLYSFSVPVPDMVTIYMLYVRSLVEQNVAVWNSSITAAESEDLERVQKVAVKIILKNNYTCYEESLKILGLEKLKSRRSALCLAFAKKCLKNEKMAALFPINPNYKENSRCSEKYRVNFANNNRLQYSAIPALQRLLNENCK